jgi:hypothetical protein
MLQEADSAIRTDRALGGDAPPIALERMVRRPVPLDEAFLAFARFQEEQARLAAELLERERWALTLLLARSAPLWRQAGLRTLRFAVGLPAAPAPYHIELGSFAHLAALAEPSAEEQALVAGPVPSWARVAPHPERQQEGQSGALTGAYFPIETAEAVATLGFRRIVAQLEDASQTAAMALLAEARAQAERERCLLAVEHMLHVAPEPAPSPEVHQAALPMRLLLPLMDPSGRAWFVLLGACLAGVALLCGALTLI